ncbi:FAD dependent oxidoreductase [Aspergillus pseudoustus]|uniref:FAD dependent oxidoreductase n=1 Tax=Aspergillus pseudoustus TaxID=1810923 RepID=A0ABR4JSI8_9EURO
MSKIQPVPNPTPSYWLSDPHWLDSHRSTPELPSESDIVIIGTGIAGASTAYNLIETFKKIDSNAAAQPQTNPHPQPQPQTKPQRSILLLEARTVCSGATGRNGGHIKKLPSTIPELIQTHGTAVAGEIVKFVRENIFAVKDVIEKEGIEAEAELRRSFDVCLDADDADTVGEVFEELRRGGFPTMEEVGCLKGKFVERITSIHGAKTALSTPILSLWPYKFVTQLLERVLRTGNANLQTNTPVTSIETIPADTNNADGEQENYIIKTPRGDIKTRTLILATNGYTAGLLPQYRNVITPAKATASHIAVPPNRDPAPPYLSNTYNIRYTVRRVDYLNPRPDGGIVVGGGKWTYQDDRELWYDVFDDSTLVEPARGYFDGLMQRNFRGWEQSGALTESVWTGIQGLTKDGMPHVGRVPGTSGQYILAGYNGGGMALAFLAARAVARMVGEGVAFAETGVPKCMETTIERFGREQ